MPTLRKTEIALAMAALSLSLAVHAQSTAPSGEHVQRIEITGSNIKRIDAETADPVQIIRREEIQNSGATTLRELLDTLPSTNNGLSDIGGSNSFASGATSASMRNLGKQSTLVLLNSRRVSPYALADFNEVFTNIDTLPLDAVERVEILKNGASAIYGSDAVAGVINVITRKDYHGLEVGGDYQKSLVSHRFGEGSMHATWGLGDLERDGYNLLANAQYFKREAVGWRDVLQYSSDTTLSKIPHGIGQYSTYSYPGNLMGGTDTNGNKVTPHAVAGCDASLVMNGLCMYDRYAPFLAQPSAERANLLLSGTVRLGDTAQWFSELLYARTKTSYQGPKAYYGWSFSPVVWADANSDTPHTFYYRGLPAQHPLNDIGSEEEFRYRFVDAPSGNEATSDNYRLLTGLRGSHGGYDWETAIAMMGGAAKTKETGAFSDSGFKTLIGDYNPDVLAPDFFNKQGGYKIGQPNSADVLNALFPTYGYDARIRQVAVDGKVSGELGSLPAGPIGFATGFDLRRETLRITPTQNLRDGDVVGFGSVMADAARNFGAVFGELNLPITKTLESQVAARADKFPGMGAHISPKIALRFQPIKELMLRGSVETGFRAPNLTENANSSKTSFAPGVTDPKRCPQAAQLADDLRAQANLLPDGDPQKTILMAKADTLVGQECSKGIAQRTSFNPDLKPEVSRSYTVGFVFQPMHDLSLQVDYWNIQRKDEIGLKSVNDVLEQEANPPAGTQVRRDPDFSHDATFDTPELRAKYGVTATPLSSVTNSFENSSRTRTSGFDFDISHSVNTDYGKLSTNLVATYLHELSYYSTVKNDWGDNLAGRYGAPRFGAKLKVQLVSGAFTNGLIETYYSPYNLHYDYYDTDYDDAGCAKKHMSPTECMVGAYSRLDYFFTYKGIKNLTLSAYVRNLLNAMPPYDARAMGPAPIIPTNPEEVQRRTLRLGLSYKFF